MTETSEQTKLRAWLREWQLDEMLQEESPAGEALEPAEDFSGEPAPCLRQIRLFPAADSREEPCYVCLLDGTYGRWRVLPFSRFSTPAVPGEFSVSDAGSVQVLQGWNARWLRQADVRKSWVCGEVEEAVWFQVAGWFTVLQSGGDLPDSLASRVGPPLRHPADPRYTYFDREAERMTRRMGEGLTEEKKDEHKFAAEPPPEE